MSTYDFEPDPDDYGPEPAHIANGRAYQKMEAAVAAAFTEIEKVRAKQALRGVTSAAKDQRQHFRRSP